MKKKKILLISLISLISIIFGCLILGLIIFGQYRNNNSNVSSNQEIIFQKDLNFEINSVIKVEDLIENHRDLEILNNDELIDTSSLGEKNIIVKYREGNVETKKKVLIKIVDTEEPTIEFNKELTTEKGISIDLLENVKVNDNSKEEITAFVEGEYSFDKEGEYTLKYVAIDSSGNRREEEFILKVNKKASTNTSTNNNSNTKKLINKETYEEETINKEKYGTKFLTVKTYEKRTYSDGSVETKLISTKNKMDTSGYNGNTEVLTSEAKKIVEENKTIYENLLRLVNNYRSEVESEPLTLDYDLSVAATVRALEMAYTNHLDPNHTRPNGEDCFTVLDELKINISGAVGENIAAGQKDEQAVAIAWRNSEGHYRNMIKPTYKKIGLGMVKLSGTSYGIFWAQIFTS